MLFKDIRCLRYIWVPHAILDMKREPDYHIFYDVMKKVSVEEHPYSVIKFEENTVDESDADRFIDSYFDTRSPIGCLRDSIYSGLNFGAWVVTAIVAVMWMDMIVSEKMNNNGAWAEFSSINTLGDHLKDWVRKHCIFNKVALLFVLIINTIRAVKYLRIHFEYWFYDLFY